MGMFLNTTSFNSNSLDCNNHDVSETIEHDCLSVLHKLHDQVNGLQLVQVVVQPLARLFNPASLATLVASVNSTTNTNTSNLSSGASPTTGLSNPNANLLSPLSTTAGVHQPTNDPDGQSTTTSSAFHSGTSSHNSHSRTQSLTSAYNSVVNNSHHNSILSATSTYMMSPDTAQALIARLDTDRDVNWLMEIIGYGLSMPFSLSGEQDSVKDCCTIYCEWLSSALLPYNEQNEDSKYQQLSKLVPVPIRKDPNRYARKMLSHLYNVFLPRQPTSGQKDQTDATLTAVSRQAVLCHRVLRTIETIAQNPINLMDDQTWNHLLALLLSVNDKLLSAPTEPDDIGTQLHDRILGVLFELMLLASAKSIPSPSLWKTFHLMSMNWRHRPALIDHWRRITLALTRWIVHKQSKSNDLQESNASSIIPDSSNIVHSSAIETAISSMKYENLSHTWYRFLNLVGNPVELSNPEIISRTDEFYRAACASDSVLDPRQHPCLSVLPQVFMNSMAGVKDFVDCFLGTYQTTLGDRTASDQHTSDRQIHNQSSRGSIASLSNTVVASSSNIPAQTLTGQQPQSINLQPQAVTPTQSRRGAIKSISTKTGKVMALTSSSPGTHSNILSPQTEPGQAYEHSKSISGSNRNQLMQPRPSLTSLSSRISLSLQQPHFKLYPERPKCNSILHVFGNWLFSAALIGSDLNQEAIAKSDGSTSESVNSISSASTTTEIGQHGYSPQLNRKSSQQKSAQSSSRRPSQSSKYNLGLTERITLDPPLSSDSFESGQAEAMAVLCKIFSSKMSNEDISPVYLSRFYLCIQHCLAFGTGAEQRNQQSGNALKRQLLASVLVNSTTLLQKDLDGINLLIPSFIKAIEFVFECGDKDVPIQAPPRQHTRSGSLRHGTAFTLSNVTNYDLRRACILTLLNLLAYPFHFQDLAIRNCLNESSPTTTFSSLRPRLLNLLFIALQTETDATNMQILFGGLSSAIHDLASHTSEIASSSNELSSSSRRKTDSTSSANLFTESSSSSLDSSIRPEETTAHSSFVFNSTSGFLTKSLHVTCHLLINIWKHDTQVSLAALELLTTVARVSISTKLVENIEQSVSKSGSSYNNNNNHVEMRNEYKQTSKWICDYICNQCSRPPPAHSRDMHSTIVAAYQCLSVWFSNHPYLLNDDDCVSTLMEVIELGVSGQKSKSLTFNSATGKTTQSIISRDEKILKPSSMRVKEAAESLLNICMMCSRSDCITGEPSSSYDTTLDEHSIAEMYGDSQYKENTRQVQNAELKRAEAHRLFKYFSNEDSVIFGFFEGSNNDLNTKDTVICLLRTPFGKYCWKIKFSYYTEKSREKIIANKTLGLIKRPFQQCTTPTSEARIFPFLGGHNKSLYFNSSAKFFPETLENLLQNDLDRLVLTLEDYTGSGGQDSDFRRDLDKLNKILAHQVLAEQKVMSECSIRVKRVDCEEPQSTNDLEAARLLVTHLGLKSSLNPLASDKVPTSLINDLSSLDQQSVRTCDTVSIFYVRRNRTSPREILESVRSRHNVSLAFFEWLFELGQPTVIKYHSRWTGKVSSYRNSSSGMYARQNTSENSFSRNQMLASNHGGSIFDGDRMILYWSDMCQELAFLVPHKIEKAEASTCLSSDQAQQSRIGASSDYDLATNLSCSSRNSPGFDMCPSDYQVRNKDNLSIQSGTNQDMNLDRQSLSSVASDTSSHSTRAPSQLSSPKDHTSKDHKDNVSLSRHSVATQKRRGINTSATAGCDTNIVICWLENSDDISDTPDEALLHISENGLLVDSGDTAESQAPLNLRSRDYVKYFISPMKNGLYRVNLMTSFGRHWLALPLIDGMTVSKGILSGLIRESVLNLCRRRRLDADSYQPPHVRRRLLIQDISNTYKISSKYESTEFYHNLFRRRVP